MKAMGIGRPPMFVQAELERIAELAGDGCTAEIVDEFLSYEWDNQTEHLEWLNTATLEEVADWIVACRA